MNTMKTFAMPRALVWFTVAYGVVTVLAAATTILYEMAKDLPGPEELGVSPVLSPAFVATVPYHVLIMLLVWPVCAGLYFRKRKPLNLQQERAETHRLAWFWLVVAILTDYVLFVVIQNPWSLTHREFYIDYQPWISLIYLAIFLSPWIRLVVARRFLRRSPVLS